MSATLDQQIAELKRELAIRANVYPKWVSAEKMRQAEADHCIAAMKAALHTVMAVKRLRATFNEHRLESFNEDVGLAVCACGWTSREGVEHYLDHVFERSKAEAEATAK